MKRQHYYAVFLWVLVLSGLTACVSSPELPTPTQRPTGEPEATDDQPAPTDSPDMPAGPVTVRLNYNQPPGTLDPTPGLYNQTMYLMAFLLFVALLANAFMRPVDARHHMRE